MKIVDGHFISRVISCLHNVTLNICHTGTPNRTAMPESIGQKMKLKWGGMGTRVEVT